MNAIRAGLMLNIAWSGGIPPSQTIYVENWIFGNIRSKLDVRKYRMSYIHGKKNPPFTLTYLNP